MTYSQVLAVLGAIAAALAFLPYGWAHIASGAIIAAMTSYHAAPTLLAATVKLTTPKQRPPL